MRSFFPTPTPSAALVPATSPAGAKSPARSASPGAHLGDPAGVLSPLGQLADEPRHRPQVSVVTPVFGHCPTVLACLESVAAQTGVDVEHVVVDCGCDEATFARILSWRHRITVVPGTARDTFGTAYNRGLLHSHGEFVGFLSGTQAYAHEGVLRAVCDTFAVAEADALYGDLLGVAQEDLNHVKRSLLIGPFSRERVAWGWAPPLSATFIRRHWCERVKGMSTELQLAAPYDYLVRLLAQPAFRLCYLNQPLVRRRLRLRWREALRRLARQPREEWRVMRRHRVGGLGSLAWKNLLRINHLL